MSKTIAIMVAISIIAILLGGCNYTTKKFGGETTIELREGERLQNVTWKDNSLWMLTKQSPETQPTKYELRESSNLGVAEGTVHIVER
jgi:hypothetical protein